MRPLVLIPAFSFRLRLALGRLGVTQRQFAALLGVHESAVSLWLSGHRSPQGRNREILESMLEATR